VNQFTFFEINSQINSDFESVMSESIHMKICTWRTVLTTNLKLRFWVCNAWINSLGRRRKL